MVTSGAPGQPHFITERDEGMKVYEVRGARAGSVAPPWFVGRMVCSRLGSGANISGGPGDRPLHGRLFEPSILNS